MAVHIREDFRLIDLNPKVTGAFAALIGTLRAHVFTVNGEKFVFAPFEGFRSPGRQHHLRTVDKTTKAGPWQSKHQYGLAVDFACLRVENGLIIPNTWKWPDAADWEMLKREARRVHLDVPIAWDRGHVESPLNVIMT